MRFRKKYYVGTVNRKYKGLNLIFRYFVYMMKIIYDFSVI